MQDALQQRLELINRLNEDLKRALADGEEKDRLIGYLHSEAAARLAIIERLENDLRNAVARNQELEKRLEARARGPTNSPA